MSYVVSVTIITNTGSTLTLTPSSVSNGITALYTSSLKGGNAEFSPILVTLPFDPSLPEMYLLAFTKVSIPTVTLSFLTETNGAKPIPFLKVVLTEAFVSNVTWNWAPGGPPQLELSLLFAKIQMETYLTSGAIDYNEQFNILTNTTS
jgi:type VI protein secretion system component Hcp